MPLMQIVSGAYGLYYKPKNGSFNRTCIGHTDKDGVSLRITKHSQQIQTALTADVICDLLQTGKSVTLHMNCIEAGNTFLRRMLFDDSTNSSGTSGPDEGLIHDLNRPLGRLASSFAGQFWALPLQGTTAANAWGNLSNYSPTPSVGGGDNYVGFHFGSVTIDNNEDILLALNSYARVIPVVLRALPFIEGTGSNAQIRTFKWVNEYAPLQDFNFANAPV